MDLFGRLGSTIKYSYLALTFAEPELKSRLTALSDQVNLQLF